MREIEFHGPAVHQVYWSTSKFQRVMCKLEYVELWVGVHKDDLEVHDLLIVRNEDDKALVGIFSITSICCPNKYDPNKYDIGKLNLFPVWVRPDMGNYDLNL